METSAEYKKGFRQGYNNPKQFDQVKLLASNTELAKGVIAGITQQAHDASVGCKKWINKEV